MATINLGRIKPIWQGAWTTGTAYVKDDIVREGVDSYICVTAHTAGATFAGDSANWELMAQGSDLPTQSGQAGKALVTDGTNLSWGDGGATVKLGSFNNNSANTMNVESYFDDSTYTSYEIHIKNLQATNGSGNNELQFRVITAGGNIQTANYYWGLMESYATGQTYRSSNGSDSSVSQMNGTWSLVPSNITELQNYVLRVHKPQGTTFVKYFQWQGYLFQTSGFQTVPTTGMACWNETTAITGLHFFLHNSAGFNADVDVYGII